VSGLDECEVGIGERLNSSSNDEDNDHENEDHSEGIEFYKEAQVSNACHSKEESHDDYTCVRVGKLCEVDISHYLPGRTSNCKDDRI